MNHQPGFCPAASRLSFWQAWERSIEPCLVVSMKKNSLLLFFFLLFRPVLADQPLRLAIVPESLEVNPIADVLTAAFSQNGQVQLLERTEVEKIYHEQALSAANRDYLKLGHLLGADGLILLELVPGQNQTLQMELVAVKPGVVLSGSRFSWPVQTPASWAADQVAVYRLFLPKLHVRANDAIPVSVVNLRSAMQTEESRETERQLTLLAIQRLSQEPRLFVLERRKLQQLTTEKELNGMDDSAFWNGSFLLDGTLDNDGYSSQTITLNARLIPPQGGAPISIAVSGSRTNLSKVIDHLASQVLTSLRLSQSASPWNANDEAGQFYQEARWAMKWNLYPQAQTAAESAWALGKHDPETAILLVRTYSESVSISSPFIYESGGSGTNFSPWVPVNQIPDPGLIIPLTRALDYYQGNFGTIFSDTNSSPADLFQIGLQILRRSSGLLESYYYAAENRVGHEEQLADLRKKMRLTIKALDGFRLVDNNHVPRWKTKNLNHGFAWIKAQEGGICFDHPEESCAFYRDQWLNSGLRLEGLPRIVGWSWPDRQRIPILMRRLVNDACASTNVVVRLEGLYLALLLAPDDDHDSLLHSEIALESALWEYRTFLFSNAENSALVERTRQALQSRFENTSIYTAFNHEPFAGFKHQLRREFLKQGTNCNPEVLAEFFPFTNEKMETAAQAQELLPLMEATRNRSHIMHFRQNAGLPSPAATQEHQPLAAASELLNAPFIPWKLARPGITAGRKPQFLALLPRNGQLWLCVHYVTSDFSDDAQTTYLAVDPLHGMQEEIAFPDRLGKPGILFEVSSNALFVVAGTHLYAFKFNERKWIELLAPTEGASQLVWLRNRLYIGRNDGLLAMQPETQKITLLVSSRRTPAMNEVDPLWTASTRIFPQADGRLGALAEDHCFTFDPQTEQWSVRPLPLGGIHQSFKFTADYFSPSGVQRLLTGPIPRRYLVGFWNDSPMESLLMEETGIFTQPPPAEKLLPALRWDWPKNYPMEHCQITADGKNLWVLAPRKIQMPVMNELPFQFTDDRQATLLLFTSGSRQPLLAAVHLPEDMITERPLAFGQPAGLLDPQALGFMSIFDRLAAHVGNGAFWLKTSEGLVLGGRNYCGHWLIPAAALEEKFKSPIRTFQP